MSSGPGAYARAIERCWAEAVGRPVVLSPREWTLISDWHERSIPLAIVAEAIHEAVVRKTRRGAKTPRTLGYIAAAVEEAWGVVVDGRPLEIASAPSSASPPDEAVLARWRRRISHEPEGSPLSALLRRLLARYAAGADAEEVERELACGIEAAVPEALLRSTREQVERQLAGFRDRMDSAVFRATRSRAIVARLRRTLDLPPMRRARDGAQLGQARSPHPD